jgi:hypothetical protein
VVSLDTAAPDRGPREMTAVRGCILDAIGGLRFPERRSDTMRSCRTTSSAPWRLAPVHIGAAGELPERAGLLRHRRASPGTGRIIGQDGRGRWR